ncbi:hypothetical protein [Chryseobacterium populi]|uniref:Rubredoxin-like domain-containing protein n=1 Tax=Chryseobacterium populi TaxID=1144316 RepID=J2JSW1_9FLAO|nr:hypothetical protein [Chryseobacterium populi]EJL70930.1 hypothetical protein PMI13_02604 [Chryseobacterium populi]
MKEYICKACGFNNYPEEFWEDDNPMYIICPCCGCESGNEDYTIESAKEYRMEWIKKGTKWFDPSLKPNDWDFSSQLKKIPEEYI